MKLRIALHSPMAGKDKGFSLLGVLATMAFGGVVIMNLNQDTINNLQLISLDRQSDSAKVAGNSGLNLTAALLRFPNASPSPGQKPAVYPDPYIPSRENEPIKLVKLNSTGPKSNWDVVDGKFLLKLTDLSYLPADAIENAFSSRNLNLPETGKLTTVRVIDTQARNYLIESLKVETTFQTKDGRNIMQRAVIEVPRPPQPRCRIASSLKGAVASHESLTDLSLTVDGIATQGLIRKNKAVLSVMNLPAQTRSIHSLNATIFDQPVSLEYGSNELAASIQNVEGQVIDCGTITIVRQSPPPPPRPVPPPSTSVVEDCSRVCPDSTGTPRRSYDWFKGPTQAILNNFRGTGYYPCLLVRAGKTVVDGAIIGFDPKKNCAAVGRIGNRGGSGCFSGDTMIRVAPDQYHPIHQFVPGMQVWNPLRKEATRIKRIVRGPEKKAMLQVWIGPKTLKVTNSHPFYGKKGLVEASELKVGMMIRNPEGDWARISRLQLYTPEESSEVWNLELESADESIMSHALDANGIVTGDLYLQEELETRKD